MNAPNNTPVKDAEQALELQPLVAPPNTPIRNQLSDPAINVLPQILGASAEKNEEAAANPSNGDLNEAAGASSSALRRIVVRYEETGESVTFEEVVDLTGDDSKEGIVGCSGIYRRVEVEPPLYQQAAYLDDDYSSGAAGASSSASRRIEVKQEVEVEAAPNEQAVYLADDSNGAAGVDPSASRNIEIKQEVEEEPSPYEQVISLSDDGAAGSNGAAGSSSSASRRIEVKQEIEAEAAPNEQVDVLEEDDSNGSAGSSSSVFQRVEVEQEEPIEASTVEEVIFVSDGDSINAASANSDALQRIAVEQEEPIEASTVEEVIFVSDGDSINAASASSNALQRVEVKQEEAVEVAGPSKQKRKSVESSGEGGGPGGSDEPDRRAKTPRIDSGDLLRVEPSSSTQSTTRLSLLNRKERDDDIEVAGPSKQKRKSTESGGEGEGGSDEPERRAKTPRIDLSDLLGERVEPSSSTHQTVLLHQVVRDENMTFDISEESLEQRERERKQEVLKQAEAYLSRGTTYLKTSEAVTTPPKKHASPKNHLILFHAKKPSGEHFYFVKESTGKSCWYSYSDAMRVFRETVTEYNMGIPGLTEEIAEYERTHPKPVPVITLGDSD